MVVFRAGMTLSPMRRSQVVRSFRRILAQTRVSPGCMSCRLCADVEDENRLVLIEEWTDLQSLRSHLREDSFRVVLSALDYAADQPQVQFDTVADTRGMEFITACRGCGTVED